MDFTHTGAIGGFIAGRAARQEEKSKSLEMANTEADIQAKQLSAIAQQDMTRAVKEAGPSLAAIEDPAERLVKYAEIVSEYNPGEAADFLAKAASAHKDMASAEKTAMDMTIESANTAASILDNVYDGPSLEAMFQRTQMQGIDTKGVLPGMYQYYKENGWDDGLEQAIKTGRAAIMSKKDSIQIKLDEQRMQSERLKQRETQLRMDVLIPAEAAERRARTASLSKAGDVEKTKVTAEDRAWISHKLGEDYDLEGADDAKYVLASEAVERTKELLLEQPTLTKEQAREKVYRDMKKENRFAGLPEAIPEEGTRSAPAPMPLSKKGQIEADKLEKNRVYQGTGKYADKSFVWDGEKFVLLGEGGE